MVWTIARREFLEYLKSLRFVIGFAVTLLLTVLSTFINLNDFAVREAEYSSAVKEMTGNSYRVVVYRPPEVLSTLVQGSDRSLGNQASMDPTHIPVMTSGFAGSYVSQQHQFGTGFPSMDLAFVVRVIMSLLVIFLAYDTVAGEKSAGTLRLVLSNGVRRRAFLLGKSLGGMILVMTSLGAALAFSVLVMITHPQVATGSSEWARIGGMAIISALYLGAIYTLTVLASVAANRPSTALLILLQVWLLLVVIYPALAVLAGSALTPLPGDEQLNERKRALFAPYQREAEQTQQAFNDAVRSGKPVPRDVDLKEHDFSVKKGECDYQADIEQGNAQSAQRRCVERLLVLSPPALYERIMVQLARTGPDEFDSFIRGVRRYWDVCVQQRRLNITDPEGRKNRHLPPFTGARETDAATLVSGWTHVFLVALFAAGCLIVSIVSFDRKDVR